MATNGSVPAELYQSMYGFLVSQGHEKSANALLKEAKIDKKMKDVEPLPEIFSFYKNNKRSNFSADTKPAKKMKVEGDSIAPKTVSKKDDSDDSDSDSDSDDESDAPPAKPAAKAVPVAKKVAPVDSSDSDDDSSDDSSSDDDAPPAKPTVALKATPTVAAKKAAASSSSSSSDDSSSDSDSDDEADKKAAAAKPVTKAVVIAKKDSDSSSDDSSDDSSSEDEKPVAKKPVAATPAKAAPAKVATTTPAKTPAKSPAVTKAAAFATPSKGEHKAFIKGLPWLATEGEITEFFASCGKTTSVELPLNEEGRSSGTAYASFASRGELDAALALDGQTWPGTERWLKIMDAANDRSKFTGATSEPGVRPDGCDTLFVGNLPWDVEEQQLLDLFNTVGEVASVRFATSKEDGSFRGFGHVSFVNGDDTLEAVKLSGTMINGRALRLDFAPPKAPRESFGGGDRDGGRGGGRGGAGRGRGGAGGRGRGTPGATTPGSKNKGSIAVSAGKKMTFD